MRLECAMCHAVVKVGPQQPLTDPFFICEECDRLAKEWKAEAEREQRALKEERLARPKYALARALLTYLPAREAVKAPASAD